MVVHAHLVQSPVDVLVHAMKRLPCQKQDEHRCPADSAGFLLLFALRFGCSMTLHLAWEARWVRSMLAGSLGEQESNGAEDQSEEQDSASDRNDEDTYVLVDVQESKKESVDTRKLSRYPR